MFNGVYRDKDGTDWENVLFLQAKTKAHKLLNDIYSVSSSEWQLTADFYHMMLW